MKHERSALFLHIAVVGRAAVARVMEATVNQRRAGKARERGTCESISSRAFSSVGLLLPTVLMLLKLGVL